MLRKSAGPAWIFGRLARGSVRGLPSQAEAYAVFENANGVIHGWARAFKFRRRAKASHIAIIAGVDLANYHHFRLGLGKIRFSFGVGSTF